MTDLNDVAVWFQSAKPGESLVYHTGNLAYDRHIDNQMLPSVLEAKRSLGAAARFLLKRCEAREVHLLQRRVKKDVCDYIAVKAS